MTSSRPTITTRYAGPTAERYQTLSDAGFAPDVVRVSEDEIEAVRHDTLDEWLAEHPSEADRQAMKTAIQRLLRRVHDEVGLCHRDVHRGNVVVDGDTPLLIDPAYAIEVVNDRCYDLDGPRESDVPVPADHVAQGGSSADGVWWGSPQRARSLTDVFGLPD